MNMTLDLTILKTKQSEYGGTVDFPARELWKPRQLLGSVAGR